MLGFLFLQHLGKKAEANKNQKLKRQLDSKMYVECVEFLKNKINYYSNNEFQKGSCESINWVKYYKHYTGCTPNKQSKIDQLAIKLISMTFLQSDLYTIYNSKLNFSLAIKKMLMEKEAFLYSMERQKELEIKIINAENNRLNTSAQYQLNKAIEKENELSKLNKLEQTKMSELSNEQLLKIDMIGTPTISELNMQGILYNKFSLNDRVNCNVYMKIYKYYYVVTSCPGRGKKTGTSFRFEKFETREEAINNAEILFNEEIAYQTNYIKEQANDIRRLARERENVNTDISNVRRIMGLDNSDNNLDGDIF